MDKYAAELAKHDASTDRQILDVWQATLATGSGAARRQVIHDR
jgi:hypothetical protein